MCSFIDTDYAFFAIARPSRVSAACGRLQKSRDSETVIRLLRLLILDVLLRH